MTTDFVAYAVLNAVITQLLSDGTETWADKVAPYQEGATVAAPFATVDLAGGGAVNTQPGQVEEFVLTVRFTADDIATVMSMAARGDVLLRNAGIIDGTVGHYMPPSGGWAIHTTLPEEPFFLIENIQGATQRYHAGRRWRIRMEAS